MSTPNIIVEVLALIVVLGMVGALPSYYFLEQRDKKRKHH